MAVQRKLINTWKLRIYYVLKYSDHEIARKLGCSQTGITRARQRLNLKPHYHHNANPKLDFREPREIYKESKLRALAWKLRNPLKTKEQFRAWQKAHRAERTEYQKQRREKQNGK